MNKALILIIFLLSGLLISCNRNHIETIEIPDLSRDYKHEIKFDVVEGRYVDKIKIKVKGFVNDTARIGNYYILPTAVDTLFMHEWYSPDYKIDYNPYKAEDGNLFLEVEFVIF